MAQQPSDQDWFNQFLQPPSVQPVAEEEQDWFAQFEQPPVAEVPVAEPVVAESAEPVEEDRGFSFARPFGSFTSPEMEKGINDTYNFAVDPIKPLRPFVERETNRLTPEYIREAAAAGDPEALEVQQMISGTLGGMVSPIGIAGELAGGAGVGIGALRRFRGMRNVANAAANAPSITPAVTPAQKLQQAIERIQPARDAQAAINTAERAKRIEKVKEVKTPGIAGTYERLGRLKGKYEKEGMPPLQDILDPADIDELADMIRRAPIDDEFTKIHAELGLAKMLRGDEIPKQSELDVLNAILSTTIELPGSPKLLTAPSKFREWYELFRGLKSVDLPFMTSAATRQGATLAGTGNWFRAYGQSIKSWGSERVYNNIMDANNMNPIHRKRAIVVGGEAEYKSIADDIGLAQSDLKTLTSREEQIRATLAERIPIYGRYIRANNRGYTAFLNTLRTKTAEDWLRAANAIDANGRLTNLAEGKRIANTINELTGHGSMRIKAPFGRFSKNSRELNLEKHSDIISTIFFAPRLIARDARMMNPLNYMKAPDLIRKKYLAGAIRRAAVWATFTGISKLGLGATVGSVITSSDFGKAKLGDTRLDAGSGLLQWIVTMGRQALGETTSSTTNETTEFGSGFGAPSRGSSIGNFFGNKIHPSLGLGVKALTASEYRPFYPGSEVAEGVLPLPATDIIDVIKDDPDLGQILLGLIGAASSMGATTYGKDDMSKPTFDIPGDPKFEGGKFFGGSDKLF